MIVEKTIQMYDRCVELYFSGLVIRKTSKRKQVKLVREKLADISVSLTIENASRIGGYLI